MATEFNNQIPFFLENVLSKPYTSIPKGAQWVLEFDRIPVSLIKRIGGGYWEPRKWDIDAAIELVAQDENLQRVKGCMFANAIQLPNESIGTAFEGPDQNGYIKTTAGQGRTPYDALQIVFLDTNISFVDNVIRPWVITTGHLGLIARGTVGAGPRGGGEDLNYRCNITIYKLTTIGRNQPPVITQKMTFFGACPISVSGEEWNYTPVASPSFRDTSFTYYYYQVESIRNKSNQPPR